jgi:hypothetical protein
MTFSGQHFMNLRHGPTFPEPPVADLDNHLQGQAAATHGQMAGGLRGIDPLMPDTLRMGTAVAGAFPFSRLKGKHLCDKTPPIVDTPSVAKET